MPRLHETSYFFGMWNICHVVHMLQQPSSLKLSAWTRIGRDVDLFCVGLCWHECCSKCYFPKRYSLTGNIIPHPVAVFCTYPEVSSGRMWQNANCRVSVSVFSVSTRWLKRVAAEKHSSSRGHRGAEQRLGQGPCTISFFSVLPQLLFSATVYLQKKQKPKRNIFFIRN